MHVEGIRLMKGIDGGCHCSKQESPMGEASTDALKLAFDRELKLGFRGVKVSQEKASRPITAKKRA